MKRDLWAHMKVIAITSAVIIGCASSGHSKAKVVKAVGGQPIEGLGLTIQASYDKRFDRLVPGYRLLNVAIINDSFDIILLNPEKDRWHVKVEKKRYPALIGAKQIDSKVWAEVPTRVRKALAYPLAIPIGGRMVVDLLVKDDVPLEETTDLLIDLDSLPTPFQIALENEEF